MPATQHEYEALDAARAAMPADTLALGAIRQFRLQDAAMLMGYVEAIRQERSQVPDPAEAKMGAENDARLRTALPAAELKRLRRTGAAMSSVALFALAARRSGS